VRTYVDVPRTNDVPVEDDSRITPRYTVINCLGMDKMAAIENVMMPIPQVAKIAVVTERGTSTT